MAKSTAAGNVTAEEYTEPTVVRDALGNDHIVGPMSNREELEERLDEIEPKPEAEQPKIEQPKAEPVGSTVTPRKATGAPAKTDEKK